MTGTSPVSGEAGAALADGKQAFERQEYPKAIEAFKKVLAADPQQIPKRIATWDLFSCRPATATAH